MADLFDILPTTLFYPLARANAPFYADVLARLFSETQRYTLPLSRDATIQVIESILATRPLRPNLQEDIEDFDSNEGLDLTAQAGAVLRYLVRCGWLAEETQADYSRAYILRSHAFRLLSIFQELTAGQESTLRYSVVAIRDALLTTVHEGEAEQRLPGAYRQMQALVNGLKELQHNIGIHVEKVLRQFTAKDVLEHFLNDYRTEIVAQAYHQLRTTDHVSRYRLEAMEALRTIERGELLHIAARAIVESKEVRSEEEGYNRLLTICHELREGFETVDQLLSLIDDRHSQFVGAAVRTIERYLSAHSTTSGQLHSLLSHILTTPASPLTESMAEALRLFILQLPTAESLAPLSRTPTPFVAAEEQNVQIADTEIERLRQVTQMQLRQSVSRDRIRRFAATLLQEQETIYATSIPVTGAETLPMIIYLRAYGDGALGYKIEELEEPHWVEQDGIAYRDFVIRRYEESE
jgi:hypothetical protein